MSVRKFSTASILSPSYKNSKIWDGTTFPGYFESIQTVTLSSNSTTVTFNNIPQNYTHLQLRCFAKASTTVNAVSNTFISFNNDGGSNYTYHYLRGNGSSVTSIAATSQTGVLVNDATVGSNSTFANMFGTYIVDLLDYTNTNKNKTVRILSGADINNLATVQIGLGSSLWLNTASITRIDLSSTSNFVQYSNFALYGIRSA
jgi:hypothetical protein